MIIVMSNTATEDHIESVLKRIKEKGLEGTVSKELKNSYWGGR